MKDEILENLKVMTPEKFSLIIEEMVCDGVTYLEAITQFMNNHQLEPNTIKKLITSNIYNSLENEAKSLNLLKVKYKKKNNNKLF